VGEDEKETQDLHKHEYNNQRILQNTVLNTNGDEVEVDQRLSQIKEETESARKKESDLSTAAGHISTDDDTKVAKRKTEIEAARGMADGTDEEKKAKLLALEVAQSMDVTDLEKVIEKNNAKAAAKEQSDKISELKREESAIKDGTVFAKADGTIHEGYAKNTENRNLSEKAVTDTEAMAVAAEAAKTAATAAKITATTAVAAALAAAQAAPQNQALQDAYIEARRKETAAIGTETAAIGKAVDRRERADRFRVEAGTTGNGNSLNKYGEGLIPKAKNAIERISNKRQRNYAENIGVLPNWMDSFQPGAREARHKIRMKIKSESSS